jgi:hypothetical protein
MLEDIASHLILNMSSLFKDRTHFSHDLLHITLQVLDNEGTSKEENLT